MKPAFLSSSKRRHRDWLGALYAVEKRLGRGDIITFLAQHAGGGTTEHGFHHEDVDGLGALSRLLRAWDAPSSALPLTRMAPRLDARTLSAGVRGFAADLAPTRTVWKSHDAAAPYACGNQATRVFSRTETQALKDFAKTADVTLPSLLLHTVNAEVTARGLDDRTRSHRWLLPVNMRRDASHVWRDSNHTTGVGVDLHGTASILETHARYHDALNPWHARFAYAASHIGVLLGEAGLERIARARGAANGWIGTFSNLGVWDFPASNSAHLPEAVTFMPPAGSPCFPVGVGILTWKGRLALGLRVHPSVPETLLPASETLTSIGRWLERLMKGNTP